MACVNGKRRGSTFTHLSCTSDTDAAAAVPSPRARFLFRNEEHLPLGGPTPPPALPVPGPVQLLPALRGLRGDSVCLKRTVFNTPFTQADVADGFHELFHHEHTTKRFYSSLHKQSKLCNCRFVSIYNFTLNLRTNK